MTAERDDTCAAFLARAGRLLAAYGIQLQRVMTDNALAHRQAHAFRAAVEALG